MRSPSISGCNATHSPGVTSLPSIPHACARPAFRCRSAHRSAVVAISRPPTGLKAHPSGCRSEPNFSTVYFANAVMVFDGLVWNTSPGACEVEPPVANSGPRSTTVTSVQPRTVSSSAREVPTIPAPITTILGIGRPLHSGKEILDGNIHDLDVAYYATLCAIRNRSSILCACCARWARRKNREMPRACNPGSHTGCATTGNARSR